MKKHIRGNTYYYYGVSKRVDGKPVKLQQVYLGTADQVFRKCSGDVDRPVKGSSLQFGLPAALYQVALDMNLIPIINGYATHSSPNLDVGQHIVLAAINRVCEPRSKNSIAKWYDRTMLPSLFTIPVKKLTGRRIWDSMDRVPTDSIPKMEADIWENVLYEFHVPLDVLIYDTTNFFSYIAEQTPSELNEKGKNKAHRHHLRQVGLAASVIRSLGLPLIHELYGGSVNDATLFPTAIANTIERVHQLSDGQVENLTVIFDKGNNSEVNVSGLEQQGVHFIGSLSPSQFPRLCSTRLSRYTKSTLDDGTDCLFFETDIKVFGTKKRVVITYNEKGARKKLRSLERNLGKALLKLNQVRWPKVKDPKAKIKEILAGKLPSNLFEVTGKKSHTKVGLNEKEVRAYKKRFGKNIIFTDRWDLTPEEVVQAYRDRNQVETLFCEMNDPGLVPFRPVRHWKDHKITVHTFICVLGLVLLKLLQLKLKQEGIRLSLDIIKEELINVSMQLGVTASGKLFKYISDRSKLQQTLYTVLNLSNIARMLGIPPNSS